MVGMTEGRDFTIFPIVNNGRATLPRPVAAVSLGAAQEETRGEDAQVALYDGDHGREFGTIRVTLMRVKTSLMSSAAIVMCTVLTGTALSLM